jgi:uncharacterized protein YjlB
MMNVLNIVSAPHSVRTLHKAFSDDGKIPNSPLPAIVYFNTLPFLAAHEPEVWERIFTENGWIPAWRNRIHSDDHYHSTAHEVLGIFHGRAQVRLGGKHGMNIELAAGDAVIIPAGVGHRNLQSTSDFAAVGAYPRGQAGDLCHGKTDERPAADRAIQKVPLPALDPLYGENGLLPQLWTGR